MQARSPDPSPFLFAEDFARLRRQLADAHATGASFPAAWSPALEAAALMHDPRLAALATRAAWRRAYEREPPTLGEQRVARLASEQDQAWAAAA